MFDDSALGIQRCQSPMEVRLAEALARASRFEWRQADDHPWEVGRWPGWMLALLAQPQYGPYRPDFGICTWVHEEGGAPPFILVVEVDGHDYHERTKEQAQRDKARDRFMTTTGAKILRFTGSEVHADANACAEQVVTFAIKLQEPHLEEEFKKFLLQRHAEPKDGP